MKGDDKVSPIREKVIKIIESLPYDLDEEILKKDTMEILKEIAQEYVKLYGIDDLSDSDKECVQALVGKN